MDSKHPLRPRPLWLSLPVLLCLTACGAQHVEPLDPRDATLPPETRSWIADAEDGVIVAHAQRDAARRQVEEVQRWRERMNTVRWAGGKSADVARATGAMSAARLQVAQAKLAYANAFVAFSEAKHRLANAERAMLHDLARYELKPLRDAAAEAKREMAADGNTVDKQLTALDKATEAFWKAYAGHAGAGGKTGSFWASGGPS